MPVLKIFLSKRVTSDRGVSLPTPYIEATIEYDGEPFPDSGVVNFQFQVDMAEPRPEPRWNIESK